MLHKWKHKEPTAGASKLRHEPPVRRFWESVTILHRRRTSVIALFATAAILVHLVLRFAWRMPPGIYQIPLLATLISVVFLLSSNWPGIFYGENSAPISLREFPSSLLFFLTNTLPAPSLS